MQVEDSAPKSLAPPRAGYPGTVRLAAVLWLALGALILLAGGQGVMRIVRGGAAGNPWLSGDYVSIICLLGTGIALLLVGVVTLWGGVKEVQNNGVASLFLGALVCLPTIIGSMVFENVQPNPGSLLVGVGLFIAGVLALAGKTQYVTWQRERGKEEKVP